MLIVVLVVVSVVVDNGNETMLIVMMVVAVILAVVVILILPTLKATLNTNTLPLTTLVITVKKKCPIYYHYQLTQPNHHTIITLST